MKKKILLILTIILIGSFGINVNADVTIGGTTLNPSAWSYIVGNRNVTILYEDDVIYPTIADIPKYFAITICSDTSKIESWYTSPITSGAAKATDVSIYKTNIPCNYPNSDYTGGRILYITGQNGYSSSVNGTNATIYNSITYYQPSDTSVVLLSASMTNEPINIDYATDTLISQNQSIIDQNQQIINGQNNIINKDHTYNNNPSETIPGQNDINDMTNAEDNLMNSLDFSGASEVNVSINPNSSNFIWNTINRLRQINPAIITLMTSILGIGIFKLILNR